MAKTLFSFPSFPLALPHVKAKTYARKRTCRPRLPSVYFTSICKLYNVTANDAHINAPTIFMYICYLHLEICKNMNRLQHLFTHLHSSSSLTDVLHKKCPTHSQYYFGGTGSSGAFSSPELRCRCTMFICLYLYISIYLFSCVITRLLYWPSYKAEGEKC